MRITKQEFLKRFGYTPTKVDYDNWFFSDAADKGVTWEEYKAIAKEGEKDSRAKDELLRG